MEYVVQMLDDADLPKGSDWCVVRAPGQIIACIKRTRAMDPKVLADCWAAARATQRRLLRSA